MSSILTNEGAMTALATLRSINDQLDVTRSEIATGKKTSNSGDNAAIWAITSGMKADVAAFKKVSSNLALGETTVAVARQGAETITDLLTDVKQRIVSAQESNVDRGKIQNDITQLTAQIGDVVNAASFNGQNLLQNTGTEAGSGQIAVLSSLDRSQNGVSSSDITIRRRDLGTDAGSVAATGGTYAAGAATATLTATQTATIDTSGIDVEAGAAFSLSLFGTDANDSAFTEDDLRTTAAAAGTQGEMATADISYVARDGDTMNDVARALVAKFDSFAAENDISSDVLSMSTDGGDIVVSSGVTDGTDQIAVNLNTLTSDAANTIGGGLEMLGQIDVTTEEGANAAMVQIESLIQMSIDSAAALGSDQGRIDTQSRFIDDLSTTLKAGIGTLEDADLEESSARLQALEVQQQLAVQALSIANRQPQQLLALFR